MLKVYCYKKCSTCKKAIKWLDNHSIDYKYYEITEKKDLRKIYSNYGYKIQKKRQHISLILVVTYIEQ